MIRCATPPAFRGPTSLAEEAGRIAPLAEYWGELCGSKELASEWADRLINITRLALFGRLRELVRYAQCRMLTGRPIR